MTAATHHYGDGCQPAHRTDGRTRMNDELGELIARLEVCVRAEEQARQQLVEAMRRSQDCRSDIVDALAGRAR